MSDGRRFALTVHPPTECGSQEKEEYATYSYNASAADVTSERCDCSRRHSAVRSAQRWRGHPCVWQGHAAAEAAPLLLLLLLRVVLVAAVSIGWPMWRCSSSCRCTTVAVCWC